MRSHAIGSAFSIALAACGSDDGARGGPDAGSADVRDPTLIWVAGHYLTEVTLTQSTCQVIQVASMPTTVTRMAGSVEVFASTRQCDVPRAHRAQRSFHYLSPNRQQRERRPIG